ncbi:uncharacterized protein K452DRAFT_287912 [Aplosporella prunicola CBS 121167]|uniref:Ubiquitin-like domain-containing protein n=1 Tax=Aplosporella prunicola CBS 121167 TaxID=1176127 RepID=A0A6A6BAD2_9PEZI|nr:uncharacterized protein K452DRAFT_287912 [Aplosporella prunicola CBS 121167]KAF2141202.1 hypothetical protein K452DRAFT_287912 [Aplosporella prunicola CBS 121167]
MDGELSPEILLIVRFTASLTDLPLPIFNTRTTTALSLKQLIRPHLPPTYSSNRLRLIHAGKVLADTAPLSTSLSLPPPPPPRSKPSDDNGSKNKGKGKERATDNEAAQEPRKLYIHCSIGDVLTPSDLVAEATSAANAEAALEAAISQSHATLSAGGVGTEIEGSLGAPKLSTGASTTAAPRGFDRLLSTGFTAAEVASLRSQFRANLSFTHTPDTMPSVAEQRVLEDRWLDEGMGSGGTTATADGETAGGDGGWGAASWADDNGLDDMLYGNVVGFFWPLGALGWGFREEGVWSRRRQIAVVTGFLLNIIFGFLKLSN